MWTMMGFSFWTAVLVIILTLFVYVYFKRKLNYFNDLGLPYLRPLPLLGNMALPLLQLKHFKEVLHDAYYLNSDAKYVGIFDFMTPVFLVRDVELIKNIAIKNFDYFTDHRGFITEEVDPLFAKNLFSLPGERWREVRNLLSPAFTSSKMKMMFSLISECAEKFTDFVWKQSTGRENIVLMKDIFTRYTNDVIATTAFGIEIDSMRNPKNDFYVLGRKATNFEGILSLKFMVAKFMPMLMKLLGVKIVTEDVGNFFKNVVATTIAERDRKGITRPDMLQLMMDARGKTSRHLELNIEEMTAQAFIFFFGGFDTSSTFMCFLAHELAVNPDMQERLQAEIDDVLTETNGKPTYESINGMPYLDALLNEANRLHSQAFILDRVCIKSFELPASLPGMKPIVIQPGTNIWFPAGCIHEDSKYYENPLKFDPERFLDKKVNANQSTYLSFGLGPRACIGNRFALLETKIVFFHLLSKCNLKPCAKTGIPLQLSTKSFSPTAKGGFWLKVEARNQNK